VTLSYRNPVKTVIKMTATHDQRSGLRDMTSFQRKYNSIPTMLVPARSYVNMAQLAGQFNVIAGMKQDADIIDALRLFEPAVRRIEVRSEPCSPSIYLDLGLTEQVPFVVCGEGLVRLFSIILELIASRDGVLLIDEIDNSLDSAVMPAWWKLLGRLVEKHNVQVFCTTHNEDMTRSAQEAFAGLENVLGLFRIEPRGDRHVMASP
jgi:hypothetical protein